MSLQKKVTSFLLVTFILWYLLKRTSLGRAYSSDMWSIPQFFSSSLGAGEGLQSVRGG